MYTQIQNAVGTLFLLQIPQKFWYSHKYWMLSQNSLPLVHLHRWVKICELLSEIFHNQMSILHIFPFSLSLWQVTINTVFCS